MTKNNKNLDNIKVLSANCRGLRETSKRYDVLNYLEGKNADIICLQDTHLMESDAFDLKKTMERTFYIAWGET